MRLLIVSISLLFLIQCTSAQKKTVDPALVEINSSIKSDSLKNLDKKSWVLFSTGLHYKSIALDKNNRKLKNEYLKKALKYFLEAAKQETALDQVYYHISECHYFLYDFDKSLLYAEKSKVLNKKNIKVYNRIYNIYINKKDSKGAAQILVEYLKVDPNAVHVQFILAEHYYRKMRDIKKSIDAFEKVIKISERALTENFYKENALYRLGFIYYIENNSAAAVQKLEQVLDINRNNLQAIGLLAQIYMKHYKLDGAEKYSRRLLRKKPKDKKMQSILGRVLYLRGDTSSISSLRKARNTRTVEGLLSWGLYYEIMKDDKKSEQLLKTVMKYQPRSICLHLALGRIYLRKGDKSAAFNEYLTTGILMFRNKLYSGAKESFTEAVKLNSKVAGVYYYLGRLHEEKGHHDLAIHYYKMAYDLKPDVDMILQMGYLHGVKKNYSRAIQYFNMATMKEPGNSRPWFFKGLVSMWQKQYPDAEKNMQKAIDLNDKNETYYFYFAIVMDKMEKLEEAIQSLQKAIKYNPKSARAYNYLGYLYADNNMEIDESLKLIKKALLIDPGNGAYTDSLGWAYYRKGQLKRALKNLLEAEEILRKAKAPDPVVFDHIGDTFNKMGKKKDAILYWKKSVEIKKDSKVEEKIKQLQDMK